MDAVNLAVGILAIVLSVLSIVVTIKLSGDTTRNLELTRVTLDEVKRETSNVTRAVDDRLQDLIRRTVPSQEDQMGAQLLAGLLGGQIDPKTLESIAELAEKFGGQQGSGKESD